MDTADRFQLVFGMFDGVVSALGVVAGGVVANSSSHTILTIGAGLAVAAAVSMAGGEYLADQGKGKIRRASIMGVATLFGSALPVAGFSVSRTVGIVVATIVALIVGFVVALGRPENPRASIIKTFVLLLVAGGLSVGASVALGAM